MAQMKPRELKRLEKELQDIKNLSDKSNPNSVFAEQAGEINHWEGTMRGPEGTPYSGGCFKIDINIPNDYPYNPPKMKFITKIWHPNISSQTGAICLDVLGKEWSPALTIRTALLSIQAMLSAPEPDDPQDAEVANQYKTDRALFEQTAKFWTETYASEAAQSSTEDDKLSRLVDMGFDKEQARAALAKCDGDETRATEMLCS
eukprot:TRINITY_DN71301_c0_g1_i1.p1 TRINITY_DN71301_c0_g1~~TRINITY_DN71301_c0_g1_i1.p1  ORF type:complete len:203 (+),score=37.48 TRINITY_DN71301_c0_g1_i1:103-711(+)